MGSEFNAYRQGLSEALSDTFLRETLERFARAYPEGRTAAYAGYDPEALARDLSAARGAAAQRMDELFEAFRERAEANGAHVHLARTAREAGDIVADIARGANCRKVVKSKSMTAEEIGLNHRLEADGLEVVESDLGEWIIQLRREGPSHMVLPAIHLSRNDVAKLFTEVTGRKQEPDVERLVKVARRELRRAFVQADMGVTGANFAVASSGALGIVTNEGNARLTTTLPRVHVALVGLEKLCDNLGDALEALKSLPRNATGQRITSYVTWVNGAVPCAAEGSEGGSKELHIVFLDNGRRALTRDPVLSEALRCIRCGACANVCPVYRRVGGHRYGQVYIGAIGLILTYVYHDRERAGHLTRNCLNCQACASVCAAGIDLPRLAKEVYKRVKEEKGGDAKGTVLATALSNPKLLGAALRAASLAGRPLSEKEQGEEGGRYLRHLPLALVREHQEFRSLPALAKRPFRDLWPSMKVTTREGAPRVALFAGCLCDRVYPEQAEAMVRLLDGRVGRLDFPKGQTCCGLPGLMAGEEEAARAAALANLRALNPSEYDYVVTPCASCGSHLKKSYPRLLEGTDQALKAEQLAQRTVSLGVFLDEVCGLEAGEFSGSGEAVAFHSPCHLSRGLGGAEAVRNLIQAGGGDYKPSRDEESCCGFGGSYSFDFPEVSAAILTDKLAALAETGARTVVTECPGCVMQLRGGARAGKTGLTVLHLAEYLAARAKG